MTSQSTVGGSLDDARLQQAAHDARSCVADYTTALKTFPNLVTAYTGRAGCYRSGGQDSAAAIHDIDRALTLSPGEPQILLQRAAADRGVGDLRAARDDYRAAAFAPSSSPTDVLVAINGLIVIGDSVVAHDILVAATARFPISAIVRLGVVDLATADDDDILATTALAQAVQLAGTNNRDLVSVLSQMCSIQVTLHQYQPATDTCQRAATMGQDGSGAYDDLAAAHLGLGQLDQGLVDMTAAIGAFQGSVGPNAQPAGVDGFGLANLLEARGRLYVEHHQVQLAIADFRLAARILAPSSSDFAARLKGDIAAAQHD